MLRPKFSRTLRLLALVTTLFAVPAASAESSWKVYDLRDLIGLIPPPSPAEAPHPGAPGGMDPAALLGGMGSPAAPSNRGRTRKRSQQKGKRKQARKARRKNRRR